MWSPRSQNDKDLYPEFASARLREIENLDLFEGSVDDVLVARGRVAGIVLDGGTEVACTSVVLCAGTFLCGKIHIGEQNRDGGRIDERASHQLSGSLASVGFETGRLKTGTPPRIHVESIDLSVCEVDRGGRGTTPVFIPLGYGLEPD